jgi:YegS/Rv2252/BmrU family lipid kinase
MLRVILNPTSRGGAGRRLRAELERELARRGLEFELSETRAPGHALELARAACADGVSAVVAAGGDGTVHEVANGLLQAQDAGSGADVALGIIPSGTGNDFVKVIPGTSTRARAYDTLARGARYPYDAARVSWTGGSAYVLNAFGTGVDVEVVRQMQGRSRRAGALTYLGALVRALRRYRPAHLRIELDGESTTQRVMMIAVANGSCVGGMFRICPLAVPNDGWLDVCVVRELGLLRQPAMALRIVRGSHATQPEVSFRRARRIAVEVLDDAPLFFQLDGELREPAGVRRLEITVQPGRLRVIAAALPGTAAPPLTQQETLRAS